MTFKVGDEVQWYQGKCTGVVVALGNIGGGDRVFVHVTSATGLPECIMSFFPDGQAVSNSNAKYKLKKVPVSRWYNTFTQVNSGRPAVYTMDYGTEQAARKEAAILAAKPGVRLLTTAAKVTFSEGEVQ